MKINSNVVKTSLNNLDKAVTYITDALNYIRQSHNDLDYDIRVHIGSYARIQEDLTKEKKKCEEVTNQCNDYIKQVDKTAESIVGKQFFLDGDLSSENILDLGEGPLNKEFLKDPEGYYKKIAEKKAREATKKRVMEYGYNSTDANRLLNKEKKPEDLNQEIYEEYCNGNDERYKALLTATIFGSMYFIRSESEDRKDEIKTSIEETKKEKQKAKKEKDLYKDAIDNSKYDSDKKVYNYINNSGEVIEFSEEDYRVLQTMYEGELAIEESYDEQIKLLTEELDKINKNLSDPDKEDFSYKSMDEIDARLKEIEGKSEFDAERKELLEKKQQIEKSIAYILEVGKYIYQPKFEEHNKLDVDKAKEITYFRNGFNIVFNILGIEANKYNFMDSDEYRGALLARMLNGDAKVMGDFQGNGSLNVFGEDGFEFYFFGDERELLFQEYQDWINESTDKGKNEPVVITSQEIEVFNYICNTEGYAKGYEYLKGKESEFDKRFVAIKNEKDSKNARSNTWLGAASIFTAIPEAIISAGKISTRKKSGQKLHYGDSYSTSNTWISTISGDLHKKNDILGYAYDVLYNTDRLLLSAVVTAYTGGGGTMSSVGINAFMYGVPTFTNTVYTQTMKNISDDQAIRFGLIKALARTLSTSYTVTKLTGIESSFNSMLNNGDVMSKINSIIKGSSVLSRNPELSKNLLLTGYCMLSQGTVAGTTAVVDQTLTSVADVLINGDMSDAITKFNNYKALHKCSDFEAYMYITGDNLSSSFSNFLLTFCSGSLLGMIKANGIISHQKILSQKINFKEAFEKDAPKSPDGLISSGNNNPSGGPSGGMRPSSNPNNGGPSSNSNSSKSEVNSSGPGRVITARPKSADDFDFEEMDDNEFYDYLIHNARTAAMAQMMINDRNGVETTILGNNTESSGGHYETSVALAATEDGGVVEIPTTVWVPDDGSSSLGSIQQTSIPDTIGVKVPAESSIDGISVDSYAIINEGTNNSDITLPFAPDISSITNLADQLSAATQSAAFVPMEDWCQLTGAFSLDQLAAIKKVNEIKSNVEANGNQIELKDFNYLCEQAKLPKNFKEALLKDFQENGIIIENKENEISMESSDAVDLEVKLENTTSSEIQEIDVSKIDTEPAKTALTARGANPNIMNMSYKGYDFVYKTSGDVNALINKIVSDGKEGKILLELDNTIGLTEENIKTLPKNVEIRVLGDYGMENFKGFKSNDSCLASLEHATYTVEEMQKIINIINEFEKGIDPNWNDATKAKYAYDFMQTINYNPKPGSNTTRGKQFDGLVGLIANESTCQGFSHIYKELLTRVGIECTEISGSMVGGHSQHAFNVVNIDGQNIIVDTVREKLGLDNFQGTGFGVEQIDQYMFKSNKDLVPTLVTIQQVNLKRAGRELKELLSTNKFYYDHHVITESSILNGVKTSNTERAQALQEWAKTDAIALINSFFGDVIDVSKIDWDNLILLEESDFKILLDVTKESQMLDGFYDGKHTVIRIPDSSITNAVYETIIHELLHQLSSPELNNFYDISDKKTHLIVGFEDMVKGRNKSNYFRPYEGFNEAVTDLFAELIKPEVSNSVYSCAYFNAVDNLKKILSLNIEGFDLNALKNGYMKNDISSLKNAIDKVAGEGFFENELCPAFNESISKADGAAKLNDVVAKLETIVKNKETNNVDDNSQEIKALIDKLIGVNELDTDKIKVLEKQISRYLELSTKNSSGNTMHLDNEGKYELQSGDLIHVTNIKNLESIAQSGILTGQAVGVDEFMETYFCADFFRVPHNESLSTFTRDFRKNYTNGLPSDYDMSAPVIESFDIAFIVTPTEQNEELLSFDPYIRDNNFNVENTEATRNFVNTRGLLDDEDSAPYAANGGYSSILYGVPASQISTVVVGDGWAVEDVEKAIQDYCDTIKDYDGIDSYRPVLEKQARIKFADRGAKVGIEDYTVDKFIDKIHKLYPNANIVTYDGTVLYNASDVHVEEINTPDEILDAYMKEGMDKYARYGLKVTLDESDKFFYEKGQAELLKQYIGLALSPVAQKVLAEIMLNGGYEGFGFDSGLCSHNNRSTELARRLSMATLYVTNSETFMCLAENGVNMFHGTNSSALASILANGLTSVDAIEKSGNEVSTGEYGTMNNSIDMHSTIRGLDMISFTDVFDVAYDYASSKDDGSFGIIIGTTADIIKNSKKVDVASSTTEIGVKDSLPVDKIKVLIVPSDKVEYVKQMVGDKDIEVLSMDDYDKKAFDYSEYLYTDVDKFNELAQYVSDKVRSIGNVNLDTGPSNNSDVQVNISDLTDETVEMNNEEHQSEDTSILTKEGCKIWTNYDKNKFNETFKSAEIDGITYYIADGEDFKFLIHVIDITKKILKENGSSAKELEQIKYLQEHLGDNPSLFINSDLDNQTISCSTINNDAMFTYGEALSGTGDIILGFNEYDPNNVLHYSYDDGGIDRDAKQDTYDESIIEITKEPINRYHYDEVTLKRYGQSPDYIISPFAPGDPRNERNILWAKTYNIPIVYINTETYLNNYQSELRELLSPFDNGLIPSASDYYRIKSLYAAINAIGKVSDSTVYKYENVNSVLLNTLLDNLTDENINNYFEIKGDDVLSNIINSANECDTSNKIFDAFIKYYNLDKECPNLSRDEMVAIMINEAYTPRNANNPLMNNTIVELIKKYDEMVKNNEVTISEYDGLLIYDKDSLKNISYTTREKIYNFYVSKINNFYTSLRNGDVPSKSDIEKILSLYKGVFATQASDSSSNIVSVDMLSDELIKAASINPTIKNIDNALDALDIKELDPSALYRPMISAAQEGDSSNWVFDAVIRHYNLQDKYPMLTRDEIVNVLMDSVLTPKSYAPTKYNMLKFELKKLDELARTKKEIEINDDTSNVHINELKNNEHNNDESNTHIEEINIDESDEEIKLDLPMVIDGVKHIIHKVFSKVFKLPLSLMGFGTISFNGSTPQSTTSYDFSTLDNIHKYMEDNGLKTIEEFMNSSGLKKVPKTILQEKGIFSEKNMLVFKPIYYDINTKEFYIQLDTHTKVKISNDYMNDSIAHADKRIQTITINKVDYYIDSVTGQLIEKTLFDDACIGFKHTFYGEFKKVKKKNGNTIIVPEGGHFLTTLLKGRGGNAPINITSSNSKIIITKGTLTVEINKTDPTTGFMSGSWRDTSVTPLSHPVTLVPATIDIHNNTVVASSNWSLPVLINIANTIGETKPIGIKYEEKTGGYIDVRTVHLGVYNGIEFAVVKECKTGEVVSVYPIFPGESFTLDDSYIDLRPQSTNNVSSAPNTSNISLGDVNEFLLKHNVINSKMYMKLALKKGLSNVIDVFTTDGSVEKNIINILKSLNLYYIDNDIITKYTKENGFDYKGFLNYGLLHNKFDSLDIEKLGNLSDIQKIKENPKEHLSEINSLLDAIQRIVDNKGIEILNNTIFNYLSFLSYYVSRDVNFRTNNRDLLYQIARKISNLATQLQESKKNPPVTYKGVEISLYGDDSNFFKNSLCRLFDTIDKLPKALLKQFESLSSLKIYDDFNPNNLRSLFENEKIFNDPSEYAFYSAGDFNKTEKVLRLFRCSFENVSYKDLLDIVSHELGHSLDADNPIMKNLFFSETMNLWTKAKQLDNNIVTSYGETKIIEDFAEMCSLYTQAIVGYSNMSLDEVKKAYPARVKILEALFDLSTYDHNNPSSLTIDRKMQILGIFDDEIKPWDNSLMLYLLGYDLLNEYYNYSPEQKINLAKQMAKYGIIKHCDEQILNTNYINDFTGSQIYELFNLYENDKSVFEHLLDKTFIYRNNKNANLEGMKEGLFNIKGSNVDEFLFIQDIIKCCEEGIDYRGLHRIFAEYKGFISDSSVSNEVYKKALKCVLDNLK